jgi:site-specific recombinase XerD
VPEQNWLLACPTSINLMMNEKKIGRLKNLEKGKTHQKRLRKMLRVLYSTGLAGVLPQWTCPYPRE